jgi:hypothetical protein
MRTQHAQQGFSHRVAVRLAELGEQGVDLRQIHGQAQGLCRLARSAR